MKACEAVKMIMKAKGMRLVDLRKRIGLENNTLMGRLSQDNISVVKLNEMLRAMDYKIVVVPCSTRVGQDSYEVE